MNYFSAAQKPATEARRHRDKLLFLQAFEHGFRRSGTSQSAFRIPHFSRLSPVCNHVFYPKKRRARPENGNRPCPHGWRGFNRQVAKGAKVFPNWVGRAVLCAPRAWGANPDGAHGVTRPTIPKKGRAGSPLPAAACQRSRSGSPPPGAHGVSLPTLRPTLRPTGHPAMAAGGHLGDKPMPNLPSAHTNLCALDSSGCIPSFPATDDGRADGDRKNPAAISPLT